MTAHTLAAVLWDMDGTLVDTEPLWLRAEHAMLARFGLEMSQETHDQLIGTGLRDGAEHFRELGVELSVDEIVDEWVREVLRGIEDGEFAWRPGARELLASLKEEGVPCALVTMSTRIIADMIVSKLPVGTFSAIVAGDEVAHEKPHPEPYLRGAAALGVEPKRALAFEDSPTGLRSAVAAGAVAIGVPNLVSLDGCPAHALMRTLSGADATQLAVRFAELRGEEPRPQVHATQQENTNVIESNADAQEHAPRLSGPFGYGDRVQLTGPKGRLNTITLLPGAEFHSHRGMMRHDDIVGLPDGSVVSNSSGEQYLALRPLLSDFVMSMPRGAAIVYPKDAAQIVSLADIFPGATVVEAGVGSGALSLHLLRAIGDTGRLHSFERREEFAEIARSNAEAFSGAAPANWSVTVGDLQEALPQQCAEGSVDRVVLDMLAPWECVGVVAEALKPGGVVICYVATVTQLSRVVEELRRSGQFTHPQASETMVRGWHVEGLAVRPDHRMVAHTGFLLTARRLAPDTVLPSLKRRASKGEFTEADVAAWTPDLVDGGQGEWSDESIGQWSKSDKVLRKKVREAQRFARESQSEAGKVPLEGKDEAPLS